MRIWWILQHLLPISLSILSLSQIPGSLYQYGIESWIRCKIIEFLHSSYPSLWSAKKAPTPHHHATAPSMQISLFQHIQHPFPANAIFFNEQTKRTRTNIKNSPLKKYTSPLTPIAEMLKITFLLPSPWHSECPLWKKYTTPPTLHLQQ